MLSRRATHRPSSRRKSPQLTSPKRWKWSSWSNCQFIVSPGDQVHGSHHLGLGRRPLWPPSESQDREHSKVYKHFCGIISTYCDLNGQIRVPGRIWWSRRGRLWTLPSQDPSRPRYVFKYKIERCWGGWLVACDEMCKRINPTHNWTI